jgi:hypothetical protein
MSFPRALERQQQAVFDRLGEDADWDGIGTVRVRRREADETIRGDFSDLVGTGRTHQGAQVRSRAPGGRRPGANPGRSRRPVADALFEVDGEPMLDRRGVWTCPVKIAA